jgi:hypothetical protein
MIDWSWSYDFINDLSWSYDLSIIYLYLILYVIYIDYLFTIYLWFPQSFDFIDNSLNGVGNLVFDNSLFNFIIFFFIVSMININLLCLLS